MIEIKNFEARNNITQSQIKQILEYMRNLKINDGLIICPKQSFPRRKNGRNVFIGGYNIKIVHDQEIGDVV